MFLFKFCNHQFFTKFLYLFFLANLSWYFLFKYNFSVATKKIKDTMFTVYLEF